MTKALFHLRQFRLLLLVLLCALFSLPLSAQEAYVLQSKDESTLTFYYDNNRKLRWGKTWGINVKSNSSTPIWAGTDESPNNVVTRVEFDDSFKNYRPITTKYWFSNLKALTTIEGFENLNTSAATDMSWMFYDCSSLTELNLSNLNTSSVTDMTRMFEGCSSLTYLNVFNFNTSSVTNMSWMFKNCSGLKELNVSNFNTSKVTDMNQMFYNCSGLKTIINPNTWRCEQSQDMFKGCTQLNGAVTYDGSKVDATMANFETGYFRNPNPKAYVQLSEDKHTLTFFYDAYRKWRSGTTWDIDKKSNEISWKSTPIWAETVVTKVVFDDSFKVFIPTTTEHWFYKLSALTTIEGLENLNTSEVTDMSFMFSGCSSLTELNLSNFNTSAVKNMWGMFSGCSSLTSLNVSNFNTSKVTDMDAMFYGCSGLTSLNLSNFNTSAVTSMNSMFEGCSSLKRIFNTNTWRCEKSQDMFKGCSQLKGVVKYDGSKVDITMANPEAGYFFDPNKKIAYVQQSGDQQTLTFYYDVNIAFRSGKTWDIDEKSSSSKPVWAGTYSTPNYAVTKVVFDTSFKDFRPTTTEGWFYRLSKLTTIEGLENLNTSEVWDMSEMFFRCYSLTSLNLSNFNTSKVTDMNQMFYNCSGLTELNVSNFNTSAVTDMREMFYKCSGLKELNVSNFKTSSVTTMNKMFSGCSSLTELNLSNFNTSKVKSMWGMFYGCSSLRTILNPNTWRNDNSQDMFYGCTPLIGAVKFDGNKLDVTMANPTTGYFTDPNREYPKAYVLQSKDESTLTFYYDNNRRLRSGKTWDIDDKSSSSKAVWAGTDESPNNVLTKVVFDTSFKDFLPLTTNSWFYNLKALTTIEGLQNLNTSAVTDMSAMFSGCSSLTSLNLSNFYPSKVTDMKRMFYNCSSLKRMFDTSTWQCEESQDMFSGCTQLNGAVKYDGSKVDATMANPTTGYFTDPNRKFQAYVLQSEDKHTLTFFYDAYRTLRSVETWDIDDHSNSSKPAWAGTDESPNNVVTKVVFDDSFKDFRPITTGNWFYNLSALTTIEGLEYLNTSAVTYMYEMFYGCSSLTSLDLSNFKTSKVTDMSQMFYNCSGLTSLNLSNFNTSKVTDMSQMFYNCSGLTSLDLSNFNTSAVKKMYEMFYNCSSLTSLNLSNFNTSKVTNMWSMFYGCSGLKELNLSNFNTSAVTYMSSMFYNCSGLTELNVSNFNTSEVTDMRYMFSGCSGLTSLNVSNFNTSAVWNMIRMFSGCSSLTSLNLSNFNTSAVTDMEGMFSRCSGLTSLNLSNFNTSAVTDVSWMFSGCSGLKTILNPNTWRCELSDGMFYGCTQLNGAVKHDKRKVGVTMANPTTGYFTDFNREYPKAYVLQSEDQHTITFYYDNNRKLRSGKIWDIDEKSRSSKPIWAGTYESPNNVVTKVVFDASFKDFRPTTTEGWFCNLSELTTIEGLENLNTSAVTDMSLMFYGCSSLTELNVSNFNTSAVTEMSAMFYGCSSLTYLNLSNFNTSKVTYIYAMFSGCSGLKYLNLSNFNTSKVTYMYEMFRNCSSLTSLNLSSFNTSAVTDMSKIFIGCSSLTSLNLSNFNTSAAKNMSGMFTNCSGLKTIFNTNTWRCEKSQDMFKGCTQLNGAVYYDASKLDVTMANPTRGYFTDPNREYPKAYVLQSEDQHTLTFYYDYNRKLRSGKTWDIYEKSSSSKPVWAGRFESPNNVVTRVVFDASFEDFRPTTTKLWFYNLKALTIIEGFQNLNTSAVTDMSSMFSGCSSLTEPNVSNFNTSKVTSMGGMFYGCSGLTSLNVSNFNTSAVTDMSAMFYDCSSLTELNVSNFNTSAVTDMSHMFCRCSGLTELNVSNFNTSAVTNMCWMFSGCSGLTSLNLSNFNTSAVKNMSYMFLDCSSLRSLNLSNLNTSVVTDMSAMFSDCSRLTELNVSSFNTSAVMYMYSMFSRCSGLTSLNISNFNTSAVKNMSWMFALCSGLTELNVSNFNTSKVTDMSYMFYDCSGLKTILNINTWRCEQSQDMFKACTQLKGAVKYDENKVDATMANPTTGYFSQKLPSAIGRVIFEDNNAIQIYDLQGKRVNANQRHLPAGFYIVNGKKVYLNEKP